MLSVLQFVINLSAPECKHFTFLWTATVHSNTTGQIPSIKCNPRKLSLWITIQATQHTEPDSSVKRTRTKHHCQKCRFFSSEQCAHSLNWLQQWMNDSLLEVAYYQTLTHFKCLACAGAADMCNTADGVLRPYLLILRAHLGDQHGHIVCVPHPGVTGEIFQNHHGFVETSDCLHHPKINKRLRRGKRKREVWWRTEDGSTGPEKRLKDKTEGGCRKSNRKKCGNVSREEKQWTECEKCCAEDKNTRDRGSMTNLCYKWHFCTI